MAAGTEVDPFLSPLLVWAASTICCRKAVFFNHSLVQTPFRGGMAQNWLHQP